MTLRRSHRGIRARFFQILILAAAAGLAVMSPVASRASATADRIASRASVPLDRMEYVVQAGSDPYADSNTGNPDGSSMHVGVAGSGNPTHPVQQDYARSYLHVDLAGRLGPDALVSKVVAKFYLTDPTELSNGSVYQTYYQDPNNAALFEACVLKAPIPAAVTTKNQPAFDCQHGSAVAVGTYKTDPTTNKKTPLYWTIDLTPLVKVWSVAGNTGAALIPISGDGGDAWTIPLSKARSQMTTVDYTLPPLPPPPAPPSQTPTYYRVPVTIVHPYPLPSAPAAPSVAPSAPPQQQVAAAPQTITTTSGPRAWVWVLPTCLAAAALVMAFARRPAFATSGAPWKARLFTDVRSYPRSYAVASIVTAWGLLFASYSAVVAPAKTQSAASGAPIGQVPIAAGSMQPTTAASAGAQPSTSTTYRTVQANAPVVPGSEFAGPGTYRTIGGVPVFFPANGGPPAAKLYSGSDDLIGIDYNTKTINLCGHAALTFGPEFNINTSDIRVFWDYLNKHGGIDGFKFNLELNDDGYDPQKAVQAAQTCKDHNAFEILGGIGFDQIPAVRAWAEINKELYIHHVVTTAGAQGLQYSYTALPSEEQMGEMAARLAIQKFRGKTVGVIWRQSPNWQSGRDLFEKILNDCHCMKHVYDHAVTLNQSNYTVEINTMKNSEHVDAVFAWENALATEEMIQQALNNDFHPGWIVFPFNLELDTLDKPVGTLPNTEKIYGIAAWDAYDPSYQGRGYASYKPLIDEFKLEYTDMGDTQATTNAEGDDLLFLAWEGFAALADMFRACLPQCTRNRMAGILLTYHKKIPNYCDIDFTRQDGHHGGWVASYFQWFRDPTDNHAAWDPYDRCLSV